MKILILIAVSIIYLETILPAFALEQEDYSYLPREYVGFVEYQSTDKNGRAVIIKAPVRYKRGTNRDYAENDSNNAVRDCHIELERAKQEKEESEKKQYSAKYYPLYYYQ